MATYILPESEKTFICVEGGSVKVYETECLHTSYLEKEYWKLVETISLGKGQQYNVLKVGNSKIKGQDLSHFVKDLGTSRLMVNREGLCIFPLDVTEDGLDVDYFRLFDVFNWSKYGVDQCLNTQWVRSDVFSGRCIAHISDQKEGGDEKCEERVKELEKELEENKKEIERLEEEANDIVPSIYLDEERKKNEKLQEELKKVEASLEEERQSKEQEIAEMKKKCDEKVKELEKELEEKNNEIERLEEEANDIVPSIYLDKEMEKNEKLQEELKKLEASLEEERQAKQQEMEEMKKKCEEAVAACEQEKQAKQQEIEEMKKKCDEAVAACEQEKQAKQQEIEEMKKKNEELEEQVKKLEEQLKPPAAEPIDPRLFSQMKTKFEELKRVYNYGMIYSRIPDLKKQLGTMMASFKNVKLIDITGDGKIDNVLYPYLVMVSDTRANEDYLAKLEITLQTVCGFDFDNWTAVKVIGDFTGKGSYFYGTFVFYYGGRGHAFIKRGNGDVDTSGSTSFPIPVASGSNIGPHSSLTCFYFIGVGNYMGFFYDETSNFRP